jgi:NAD-dependent dihydropyrimidine dehydrogenase PreA subunit
MKKMSEAEIPEGAKSPAFNRDKARRAAKNPKRPGELCRARPSVYEPKVDRRRCEGKVDCVAVCPYGVFEVRTIDEGDTKRYLPLRDLSCGSTASRLRTRPTPTRAKPVVSVWSPARRKPSHLCAKPPSSASFRATLASRSRVKAILGAVRTQTTCR